MCCGRARSAGRGPAVGGYPDAVAPLTLLPTTAEPLQEESLNLNLNLNLQEENATLQRLVASLEAQRDAATKNADAFKRHAEGLSTEYARLTREKEKLENRLSDFELLMGDAAKKRA